MKNFMILIVVIQLALWGGLRTVFAQANEEQTGAMSTLPIKLDDKDWKNVKILAEMLQQTGWTFYIGKGKLAVSNMDTDLRNWIAKTLRRPKDKKSKNLPAPVKQENSKNRAI